MLSGTPDPHDDDTDVQAEIDIENALEAGRETPPPLDPDIARRLREQLGPSDP